jgi:ABC-type dipeptide/oligopeptide/nickel transport system permease component
MNPRYRFIFRRLGIGIIQLIGLVLAVFFLIRLMPADPAARLVGMNASPEALAAARHSLGLDQPILTQLADYIGLMGHPGLLQGDLGKSWSSGAPVSEEIRQTLPITIELISLAFLGAFCVAFPIGMLCATRTGCIT